MKIRPAASGTVLCGAFGGVRRRSAAFCGVRVVFVLSARTRRYPLTRRHRSSLVREER